MTIKFLIYFGVPCVLSTLSVFVLNLNAQTVHLTGSVADKKDNPVESVLSSSHICYNLFLPK